MDRRKFYCELCHTLIPYNRKDIDAHEKTARHKKNKDRTLEEQNKKSRMENENKERKKSFKPKDEMISMMNHITKEAFASYEKDCNQYGYDKSLLENETMETIPIPELEEDKQEYKNPFANVWKTRIDATTGKLCFYNQLTKKVQFNKPVGLKLSEKEKEIWEKSHNQDNVKDLLHIPTQAGEIGGWQEIDPSEDYYKQNECISDSEESEDYVDEKLEEIEKKLNTNNDEKDGKQDRKVIELNSIKDDATDKDVIDELLEYRDQTSYGKSTIKLKNERLIQLAERNCELGIFEKPTYKKPSEENKDASLKEPTLKKKRFCENKVKIINADSP